MKESAKKGILFVISGPSGVGKGTLVNILRQNCHEIILSVSATTRKPRRDEINGTHYFFLEKEDFENRIKTGEFLEWAEFSGNLYGTSREFVDEMLKKGQNILLEIDVQGAIQVKQKLPESILIFIEPPSLEELKARLFKRKTESEEEIENRLTIVKSELKHKHDFNYCVLNDDLDEAFKTLEKIVFKELEGVKK